MATKTPVVYQDFDMTFTAHPMTGDISKRQNEKAVIQSIRNLILSSNEEIVMAPDMGGNIRDALFRPNSAIFRHDLQQKVLRTIRNHEPRCEVESVNISEADNGRTIVITIRFFILNIETPFTETIPLKRLR